MGIANQFGQFIGKTVGGSVRKFTMGLERNLYSRSKPPSDISRFLCKLIFILLYFGILFYSAGMQWFYMEDSLSIFSGASKFLLYIKLALRLIPSVFLYSIPAFIIGLIFYLPKLRVSMKLFGHIVRNVFKHIFLAYYWEGLIFAELGILVTYLMKMTDFGLLGLLVFLLAFLRGAVVVVTFPRSVQTASRDIWSKVHNFEKLNSECKADNLGISLDFISELEE